MELTHGKTTTIDVEAMKRKILTSYTPAERFVSIYDQSTTYNLLGAAYIAEVTKRHMDFVHRKEVLDNLWDMSKTLTRKSGKFGIFLYGNYGTGKSTMVRALARCMKYLDGSGEDYTQGHRIKIYDARDIAQMAKQDYKAFKNVCVEDMIAIEDMGKEPREVLSYGNSYSPIQELIERRYDRQLFTIITTNMTTDDVKKFYKERVYDRMCEMFDMIGFNEKSFRLAQ